MAVIIYFKLTAFWKIEPDMLHWSKKITGLFSEILLKIGDAFSCWIYVLIIVLQY